MNTVLIIVVLVMIVYAASLGMMWAAIGLMLVLFIASLFNRKDLNTLPRRPFLYPSDRNAPMEPMNEQMLQVKFQDDWSGHEDDDEYANLVGEKWGSGVGRGIGLIR